MLATIPTTRSFHLDHLDGVVDEEPAQTGTVGAGAFDTNSIQVPESGHP